MKTLRYDILFLFCAFFCQLVQADNNDIMYPNGTTTSIPIEQQDADNVKCYKEIGIRSGLSAKGIKRTECKNSKVIPFRDRDGVENPFIKIDRYCGSPATRIKCKLIGVIRDNGECHIYEVDKETTDGPDKIGSVTTVHWKINVKLNVTLRKIMSVNINWERREERHDPARAGHGVNVVTSKYSATYGELDVFLNKGDNCMTRQLPTHWSWYFSDCCDYDNPKKPNRKPNKFPNYDIEEKVDDSILTGSELGIEFYGWPE